MNTADVSAIDISRYSYKMPASFSSVVLHKSSLKLNACYINKILSSKHSGLYGKTEFLR